MIPHHGQTLNDRITAARYALAGQGLARVVCKATTEEMIAPKKKHIDYLLQCTHEPNVSIPQMANLLIERTQHTSWIVVFKALITVHHLMCYGNERFTQYLASSNFNFQLNNYLDKNAPKGYDMSLFIRRYARYINAKALSYRTVAFDFTKCKRGDESQMRQMGVEKLLKTVPVLQSQIDALLEFDCGPNDLTNGVINAAFLLLFKDLIRLFACYNDAIITCLEKYFELTNKKLARETLDIYKKFLIRMNKVADFLKVAENVGIDRGDIPDLTKAPSSLLDAMEQHLAALEGRKPGTTSDKPSEEVVVKKAIEEEEKFLNKLKNESSTDSSEKHIQEKKVNNPFLALSSSPNKSNETIEANKKDVDNKNKQKNDMIDLLLDDKSSSTKNSNDLFSLETTTTASDANNPFADILSSLNINTPATGGNTSSPRKSPTNQQQQQQSEFATSDGFAAAFGSSSNSNIDPKKSPTAERRPSKTAPSRPPPPPSATANKEDKSGGSAATTPSKPKQPPSRPPAPSSNTPTPSTQQAPSAFPAASAAASAATATAPGATAAPSADGSNPQLQQFFQFQQQMMQMMLQNQQQTGQPPLDPAVMMAAMQMLYAQMLATGIMPTMAQCNAAATAAAAKAEKTETVTKDKEKTNETKVEQDKSVKELKEEIEILEIEDDTDGGGSGSGQDSAAAAATVVIEDADDGFDAFGDVLQPQNVSNLINSNQNLSSSPLDVANNNNIVPISSSTTNSSLSAANNNNNASTQVQGNNTNTTGTILKGDLDATLQNLAQNLDINSLKGNYKRGQQFNPNTRGTMKTGGTPTTNGNSSGATTGSVSPSSMMIRSPIIQANTISSVAIPGISAGITGGIMGGWKNPPVMIGTGQWTTTTPASVQPMMPTMITPAMSGLPTMRHPSMIPGAVPILPSNVDASTLSTILSGNNNNNNSKVSNTSSSISATNQSQSIDPFGAL